MEAPLHYTVFGFCEGGCIASTHVDDDGLSKYAGSAKWLISWEEIMPVQKMVKYNHQNWTDKGDFFFHLRKTNVFFCQRMYIYIVWNGDNSGQLTVL